MTTSRPAIPVEPVEMLPAIGWHENKASPRVKIAVREPSWIESIEVAWEGGQPATATAAELLEHLVDMARHCRP